MMQLLDLTSGVCWSLVYIWATVLGVKHRTWCIPALAICQNFSWELMIVAERVYIGATDGIAFIIQLVWLLLDVGILVTWFLYEDHTAGRWVRNVALLLLVMTAMYMFAYRGGNWEIVAFVINAIMSAAFIYRKTRDASQWSSQLIAVLKLIGTLAATLYNGVMISNAVLLWLGGICFILDLFYIAMLNTRGFLNR